MWKHLRIHRDDGLWERGVEGGKGEREGGCEGVVEDGRMGRIAGNREKREKRERE